MTITKRGLFAAAGLVLAGLTAPTLAQGTYPERGLTLIVPYGAGGGTDVTARLLAKDMEAVLGKPVTVHNLAGGGGWIGWGAGPHAQPAGHTPRRPNAPGKYPGYP